MTAAIPRSPASVTYSVWRALFLREMVDRVFGRRAAWVWLLFEPALHIALLMVMFTVIRQREVAGMEISVWIMTGLLAFFMFNRSAAQSMNAVVVNRALFTFRQIKPVDTVIVRAMLEAFLMVLISAILFAGAALYGLPVAPVDPLFVLLAVGGLWLAGLGMGLISSVATTLVPEAGRLFGLLFRILYFTSGVLFPLTRLPSPYRDWAMLNPLLHGVEAARQGFAPYYYAMPEVDLLYLYGCGTTLVFFGLALHVRYALRLATK